MKMTQQAITVQEEEDSAVRALAKALRRRTGSVAQLLLDDGQSVEVPVTVVQALEQVVERLVTGNAVVIGVEEREYTLTEAFHFLGITADRMRELVESGVIPAWREHGEYRVALPDLLAYRGWLKEQRRKAVRLIQQVSEDEGAYDG